MFFLKFLLICRIYCGHMGSNSLLKMVTSKSADQKLQIDIKMNLLGQEGAEWWDIVMFQLQEIIL